MMNIPSFLFIDVSMSLVGLVIFSYFSECDPLTHPDPNQRLSSPNQVLLNQFIKEMFYFYVCIQSECTSFNNSYYCHLCLEPDLKKNQLYQCNAYIFTYEMYHNIN